MHRIPLGRLAAAAGALALGTALAAPAFAAPAFADAPAPGGDHAVFVQTNELDANHVVAYHRNDDGSLVWRATIATGGKGGTELNAPVDALASSGSLTYDRAHGLLLAVNAGSDSVSVFGVDGDRLELRQVLPSGGSFPTSVAVHDDLAYVLNAGGAGSVQGFRIAGGGLRPLPGSNRTLGLANTNPPLFITSPAQVGFSPDGAHVVVTTKLNGTIDTFQVGANGRLSAEPVVTPAAGVVPFSFTFDATGHLVLTTAGDSAVATYAIGSDGTTTLLSGPVGDGAAALCWIVGAGGTYYAANTGSSTLSAYRVATSGAVSLVGQVATTSGAPIDIAATADGAFVYSQNAAAGTIDAFAVHADGSLTPAGVTTGLPAFNGATGMEGIVAL